MLRRTFLISAVVLAAGTGLGLGLWRLPRADDYMSLDEVRNFLALIPVASLKSHGAMSPAQALLHCSQSIDFSIEGYPEQKPKWFQNTLGPLALALFSWRNGSRHDLSEPIPGAPALDSIELAQAMQRLISSIDRFLVYQGPLQPHFAYGPLNHQQYAKAHSMHIIEHLTQMYLG